MLSFIIYILNIIVVALIFSVPINTILDHVYKSRKTSKGKKKPSFLTIFVSVTIIIFLFATMIKKIIPNLVTTMPERTLIEVRNNLNTIYSLQKSYRAEHGVYAGAKKNSNPFDEMEWFPTEKFHYSYYCGDHVRRSPGARDHPSPGTGWPYPVKPLVSKKAFICMAVGNLDEDPFMDIWMINDRNNLRHLYNDDSNTTIINKK